MRRLIGKALVAALGLVAVALIAAYLYARQSLPAIDGSVTVAGLSASVEIVRDADAIPHIFASTKLDALYGLGYAHAQDRLWQMEFQRRIGHGRLSEIFGAATLPQDRFLRTVGFGRAAQAAWASLPQGARQQIDAYVAGVNAFLLTHHGRELPLEFRLLGFEPDPWTGADVLVWVKMMAWDLSKNYALELLRHDIVSAVGKDRMADLMSPYPIDGLSILSPRDMSWASVPADALSRIEVEAAPGLWLLPRGGESADATARADVLASLLLGDARTVVADCGVGPVGAARAVAAAASVSLLVVRPCYVALRRALAAPLRPSGVVLVSEPGRALGARDVEDVLGVPVRAEVTVEAAVARAVDAGLLTSRFATLTERALRRAA